MPQHLKCLTTTHEILYIQPLPNDTCNWWDDLKWGDVETGIKIQKKQCHWHIACSRGQSLLSRFNHDLDKPMQMAVLLCCKTSIYAVGG